MKMQCTPCIRLLLSTVELRLVKIRFDVEIVFWFLEVPGLVHWRWSLRRGIRAELEISIPDTERYPFKPPKLRFITPIYHPNVDTRGRICLDILKMPPHGSWKPSINIFSILTGLQVLIAEPNPEDPLMTAFSDRFRPRPRSGRRSKSSSTHSN